MKKKQDKTTPPTKTTGNKFIKGNKMYLLRGENEGRPRKFTPQELAQAANDYFNHIDANPIFENAIHQRSGEIIKIPRQRPYTIEGLCNHIGAVKSVLWNYENLKESDQEASDFKNIITRIKQICYAQKLEGAAVGIFNSNIIARELGLTEKTETNDTGTKRLQIELINTGAREATPPPQERPQTIDITAAAEIEDKEEARRSARPDEALDDDDK